MNHLLNNEYFTNCLIKIFHSLGTIFLSLFFSFGIVQLALGNYYRQNNYY